MIPIRPYRRESDFGLTDFATIFQLWLGGVRTTTRNPFKLCSRETPATKSAVERPGANPLLGVQVIKYPFPFV
jgi:hypothetical protein